MIRGGPELAQGGMPWPTGAQALIVKAAVGPEEEVEAAFRAWCDSIDIEDHMDGGSFRLLPLVYDRLRKLGVEHPLMGRLKGVYRRAWVETNTLLHELAPTVAALEAAGIPTLVLKGAPLGVTYYGAAPLRPMFDLDVAVPFERRNEAIALLESLKWMPRRVHPDDMPDQHGLDFRSSAGREIDLHWAFLREVMSPAGSDWFWTSARPFEFEGVKTRQLSPTATLLHTVVHGVRSNVEPPIRWIVDAGAVLRAAGDEIDWDELVAYAKAQKLSHRLSLGLSYLAREYDLPIPAEALNALKSHGVSIVERVENLVYLRPAEVKYRRGFHVMVDYWRHLRGQSPLAFALGYGPYLQRRWRLSHPLQAPLHVLRRLGQRIGRSLRGERRWFGPAA